MSIVFKPIVTEKASVLSEDRNVYTFQVSKSLNKIQIKEEIAKRYGVNVLKVNVLNTRIERKSKFTKSGVQQSKKSSVKKAMVKVAEGDKIDFYNNV